MATRFSGIELGPPIEVFALQKAYVDDTFENKVNLAVGGNIYLHISLNIFQNSIFWVFFSFLLSGKDIFCSLRMSLEFSLINHK